jgi:hypothetical protein
MFGEGMELSGQGGFPLFRVRAARNLLEASISKGNGRSTGSIVGETTGEDGSVTGVGEELEVGLDE